MGGPGALIALGLAAALVACDRPPPSRAAEPPTAAPASRYTPPQLAASLRAVSAALSRSFEGRSFDFGPPFATDQDGNALSALDLTKKERLIASTRPGGSLVKLRFEADEDAPRLSAFWTVRRAYLLVTAADPSLDSSVKTDVAGEISAALLAGERRRIALSDGTVVVQPLGGHAYTLTAIPG